MKMGENHLATPRKTNMVHLKMNPWKRRFLLETIIFRFHVSFRGGVLVLKIHGKWIFTANIFGKKDHFFFEDVFFFFKRKNGRHWDVIGRSWM